jgi:tetratricopeptide (TPR) repeat protein
MTEQPHPRAALPGRRQKFTVPQAFARATALHRQRKVAEAERIYQAILQLDARHVGSLHNLGSIRTQQGRAGEAVRLLARAVELEPDAPAGRNDFGMALAAARRFAEAAEQYERALAIRPDFIAARGNLANVLVSLGRADEAIEQLEQAIALRPQMAELYNNLGNALAAQNRHAEAVVRYRGALAIRPDFAAAHNNIGISFAALGRAGQAIAHYEQAIALKPDYGDASRNLGKAMLARNRPQLALPHLARAVELKADAEAHNDLANAMTMLERHQEAVEHYRQALAKSPEFAPAHNNLGNALVKLGRDEEAMTHFRRALAIAPDYPEALSNLGNALLTQQHADEAIRCFERALEIRPDIAQAHSGLAGALQALGRLDEARAAIERALALAPGNAAYYHRLCAVKRFAPGDPHLAAMQALAREMDALPPGNRVELHFALGKALADVGDHEQAFRHYVEGNALHRAAGNHNEEARFEGFERVKRVFTADLVRARAGHGDPSDLPIFIVGMPRSGTTLVEQILASHPRVFAAGELADLGHLVGSIRDRDRSSGFPELVPSMTDDQLRAFGASYLAAVRKLAPASARITDKMPGNFQFAGLIHLTLPNARIIHLRRDPVDTCLSLFTHLFTNGLGWSYDLGEIGRNYRAYASLMEHWRAVLPPGAMLEVRYEELVADFEPQARRLVAYCGLDWDDRCLSFHKAERPVWTASLAQVRQPIYRAAIGRSQPYLPMLGPLLEALGDAR